MGAGGQGLTEMADDPIVVMVAAPSKEIADAIAQALVARELAACVQAVPVSSTYRWQGKIESAEEILLLIKTRAQRFGDVEAAVIALHPYEVPEIVSIPTDAVHGPYRDWLLRETGLS